MNINSNVPSDPALADSMCLYIGREKPLFTFIAFGEPDETGHRCGWESDEYFEMCKQIDGYVGKIMETLEKNDMKDDAIVFFTADHGGTGKGHGGISMKEMETPFVVCGKGIKQGHEIPESVMVFDCAPTIGHIFSDRPAAGVDRATGHVGIRITENTGNVPVRKSGEQIAPAFPIGMPMRAFHPLYFPFYRTEACFLW